MDSLAVPLTEVKVFFWEGRISPSYTPDPGMKCIILDKSRLFEIPGEEKLFQTFRFSPWSLQLQKL